MIFPFLEKKFLSIDFGSLNIKIVEGRFSKENLEIINFGMIPIYNIKDTSITSYILEENFAAIIKSFIKEADIKSKNTYFVINAPHIFPVDFLIPPVGEKNIPQIVKFEAQKQIPLGLEEIETEYRYIHFESESEKKWLVFLCGVPKSYLRKIESIAELSNLKYNGTGMEYFNFEPFLNREVEDSIVIDLGHSYSTLSLFRDGRVIYGNQLKIRGYDLISLFQGILQLPLEDTINFIKKRGFLFNPEEKELKDLAESFSVNIEKTIKGEIEKLENNFLLRVKKIYWTGGLSILPGFGEKVINKFQGFQTQIIDVSKFVSGEKFKKLGEKSSIFAQAVGLLLKNFLK